MAITSSVLTPRTKPELEVVDPQPNESIRYLQHGSDSSLIRWHYHAEYELHLIVATKGKMFVGDHIGNFGPKTLVLAGPNLPHNWISQIDDDDEEVPLRDRVVQFSGDFIERCCQAMPELGILMPLLQRSRRGVMFDQATAVAVEPLFEALGAESGFPRIVVFFRIMEHLARTENFRLLSSMSFENLIDESTAQRVNLAVNYIVEHYQSGLALDEVAALLTMTPTAFSKFFKRNTGLRFIEFVNNLRVSRACERLVHSDDPITDICFEVGFNNIANFNRRFQALKGMTPSDYRRQALIGLRAGHRLAAEK